MTRADFNGMCELATEGRLTWVERSDTHMAGRVMGCDGEVITVAVGKGEERWDRRDCRELTHGYRVNYDEVRKHPHEFDSHRD